MLFTSKNLKKKESVLKYFDFFGLNKWLDWLVKIRDPRECWKSQPTYLLSEITYLTIGLLTFIHCNFPLTLLNFESSWCFQFYRTTYSFPCSFVSLQLDVWAVVSNIYGWPRFFTDWSSNVCPIGYLTLTIFGTVKQRLCCWAGGCRFTSCVYVCVFVIFQIVYSPYRRSISLDPTFIYNASVAISRLKLPNWAEPFAG